MASGHLREGVVVLPGHPLVVVAFLCRVLRGLPAKIGGHGSLRVVHGRFRDLVDPHDLLRAEEVSAHRCHGLVDSRDLVPHVRLLEDGLDPLLHVGDLLLVLADDRLLLPHGRGFRAHLPDVQTRPRLVAVGPGPLPHLDGPLLVLVAVRHPQLRCWVLLGRSHLVVVAHFRLQRYLSVDRQQPHRLRCPRVCPGWHLLIASTRR
uniref:(northern house mosquito) hypothetical protein n=1 Tax=Culex pipiens TaxID=7175 RepID=A0A8D8C9V7_CULPI